MGGTAYPSRSLDVEKFTLVQRNVQARLCWPTRQQLRPSRLTSIEHTYHRAAVSGVERRSC